MPVDASAFKRPESVLVVIFSAAGEVLLLRRVRPASFWQSVTGSMEWHETDPLETARRELTEETGLGVSVAATIVDCHSTNQFPIKPAWRHRYAAGIRHNLEHVFRLELPQRSEIILQQYEHTDYIWLPRPQALKKVTSYTNRDAIEKWVPE